jgi:hypothetical protein
MSLLRATQPGSTRSINTYVKTYPSFKQRRTEAEEFHAGRKLIPSPLEYRWSKSGERVLALPLRRSDALSHIHFFKKRVKAEVDEEDGCR